MLGLASAGMSAMSAIGGLVGVVGGFGKKAEGKRMQRLAAQKIRDFKWQDLTNPYKNLSISTAGAEFRRDEAARATATATQGLRSAGARGILGGMGRVVGASNDVARDVAANLDEQQRSIDAKAAQDDVRIRDMVETRQSNELAGYGQMMNVGMGMKHQGVANIAQGFSAMGSSMGNLGESLEQMKLNNA